MKIFKFILLLTFLSSMVLAKKRTKVRETYLGFKNFIREDRIKEHCEDRIKYGCFECMVKCLKDWKRLTGSRLNRCSRGDCSEFFPAWPYN